MSFCPSPQVWRKPLAYVALGNADVVVNDLEVALWSIIVTCLSLERALSVAVGKGRWERDLPRMVRGRTSLMLGWSAGTRTMDCCLCGLGLVGSLFPMTM
jgi:hypothetical protein